MPSRQELKKMKPITIRKEMQQNQTHTQFKEGQHKFLIHRNSKYPTKNKTKEGQLIVHEIVQI